MTRNNKSRSSEITKLGDGIAEMLDNYHLKKKFGESKAVAFWEKMMGNTIAKRTEKVFVRDGKMFVRLSSSPLKKELLSSRSKILEIIKQEVGEGIIDEVVIL